LKSAASALAAGALGVGLRGAFAVEEPLGGPSSAVSSLLKPTVGFMLAHEQFRVPELLAIGTAAENSGFGLLATSDHLQPWQSDQAHSGEAWVTLGALGQRTKRIWMGTTVTCPTFRYNPAVVAEAFASMSWLNPGRIFLGLGSGEALNEEAAVGQWPKWQERSQRLIEATDVIRKLWTGKLVDHKGTYYTVNAKLYDPPPSPIPLLMAANGPKAMRRAGQYGDGLVTDPKTWKQHKAEFEAGAKAAGKDITQMPVLVEQYVVVGNDNDAKVAAQLWRFGPKSFESYYNVRDPEKILELANSEIPLEKVYSDWPVSTDPADHIKVVTELFQTGASIVNIHSGQPDQRRVIDFYGREVLPKIANSLKGTPAAA
jgi:TAT-translocated FGD2 family F420-dependent dehydrogenase